MKKENLFTPINVIAALLVAALVLSAAVTFVLFDRSAYVALQKDAGLPAQTGMSEDAILENYNALIDYNSVFFRGPLVFPGLPMSEAGRIHFAEVKVIFDAFQIAFMVAAVGVALCCALLFRKRLFRFLMLGGIFALLIPAVVVSVMGAVGWDEFFVLFHRLLFNNDFWVFDAGTDPVILILPDAFFLNCLERIVVGIVVGAAALIAVPLGVCRWLFSRSTVRDPHL